MYAARPGGLRHGKFDHARFGLFRRRSLLQRRRGTPPRIAANSALAVVRRHELVARALHGQDVNGFWFFCFDCWKLILGDLHSQQPLLQLAVGGELGGGHRARDAAVHHHVDGVGDLDRDAEVLLDEQHRDLALGGERFEHGRNLLHDDRREALGRLVHHQQLRVEEQRARNREHLLLAARELSPAISSSFQKTGENLVDALHGPGPFAGHQTQMLVYRERWPDSPALRHVADALVGNDVGREAEDFFAVQLHAACRGTSSYCADQAGDRVAQRGLAHAVAADHRDDSFSNESETPAARGRGRSARPGS